MPTGLLWELARILSLLGRDIKSLDFDVLLPYRAQPNQKAVPAVLEHCKALFGFEAQAANAQFAAAFSQEKSAQVSQLFDILSRYKAHKFSCHGRN